MSDPKSALEPACRLLVRLFLLDQIIPVRTPDMLMGIKISSRLNPFFREKVDERSQVGFQGSDMVAGPSGLRQCRLLRLEILLVQAGKFGNRKSDSRPALGRKQSL